VDAKHELYPKKGEEENGGKKKSGLRTLGYMKKAVLHIL